jgi:phosphoglycolate phosphatase
MKKIDTVIFDLDGTLLNTLDDLTDSVNFAMKQYRIPKHSKEDVRCFVGNGVAKLIERAIPQGRENPCYEQILDTFKQHYALHCEDKTKAYDGILDMLEQLQEKGFRLAVVSNKFDGAVKKLRDRYFGQYISVAIGESGKVRKKPAPDAVYQALRELSADAENAVYVGDSEVDLTTAVNVPMTCVSVTWGFRTRQQLLDAGAKKEHMITAPQEFLPLLERLHQEA